MSKKIHFFIEYAKHYLQKYFWVILSGAFFGSLFFFQRGRFISLYQTLQKGNTYIGIEGLYSTSNLPESIARQISNGFTIITENNKPVLSELISQMSVDENNLVYTFTFKDNLLWQNGKKFSPKDIELKIPGVTSNIIASNKLRLLLDKPYSAILSQLSKPLFLRNSLFGLNGQFSVQNLSYQDGYIKQLTLRPQDNSQNVVYHFYANSVDLSNAFKLGEVDQITSLTLDPDLSTWPKIKISQNVTDQQYLAIFINTNKLDNKQTRQALAYATPKTNDKNSRCLGPISPNSWAYNPEIKNYNLNPTKAQELLPKNSLQDIKLLVAEPRFLPNADKIKQSWEKTFGIKVNVSIVNQQFDANSYDVFLGLGPIPTDPDQYALWHSTQDKTNITHLNNSRIDKLLEEGRQATDQQQRKNLYYDFQRFLLEESPVIFLEFPTTYTISRIK